MDDFASTFFVAIIREALRRQNIALPDAPPERSARLALPRKKELLATVLARHGPAPLLQVGLGLPAFDATPPARLFAAARTPASLFERWLRLERYVHSRHRSRFRADGDRAVRYRHFAARGPAPEAGEDLVVAGLLAALLQRLGAQGVRLTCEAGDGSWPALVDGAAAPGLPANVAGDTDRWRLEWRDVRPPEGGARAPDSLPGRAASGSTLDGRWQRRVLALVAADPVRRLTLAACAGELGLSARSLQRRLGEEGLGFQAVVAAGRQQVASTLLADEEIPIGMVGLLAGYSDQPHFSRQFRDGTGLTPLAYRQLVRADGGPPD